MIFVANDLKCDKHGAHNFIQVQGEYECSYCLAEERDNLRRCLDRMAFEMATLKRKLFQFQDQAMEWQEDEMQPKGGGKTLGGQKTLTKRQRDILVFICTISHHRGRGPTIREIGKMFGITSTNGVRDHLMALRRKNYLFHTPYCPIEVRPEIRDEFAIQ